MVPHSAFDQWVDPVAVVSADNRLIYGNDALARFFGLRSRAMTGGKLNVAKEIPALPAELRDALVSREERWFGGYREWTMTNAQGLEVTMQVLLSHPSPGGEVLLLFRDVSVEIGLHRRYLKQISENEALIARLRRQLQETETLRGLVALDHDDDTRAFLDDVSALARRTLGFEMFELMQAESGEDFAPVAARTRIGSRFREDVGAFASQIAQDPKRGYWAVFNQGVLKVPCLMAKPVWAFVEQSIAGDRSDSEFFKLFGIQLARLLDAQALMKMSMTDHLTGLFNRRTFDARLELELSRSKESGRPLALVLVDVDHFKRVNDQWGHPAGDEVLKALGACLQRAVRRKDAAFRLGGEEFGVLLTGQSAGDARIFAERLRQDVAGLVIPVTATDGRRVDLRVTASFGIAEPVPGEANAEKLYAAGDEALYEAKRTGRNRVVTAA